MSGLSPLVLTPAILEGWERWLKSIDKTSDPRGCWNTPGAREMFWTGDANYPLAHIALIVCRGVQVPLGKIALHSCDNTHCVCPDHLEPGTHAQNTADMIGRNRHHPAVRTIMRQTTAALAEAGYLTIARTAKAFDVSVEDVKYAISHGLVASSGFYSKRFVQQSTVKTWLNLVGGSESLRRAHQEREEALRLRRERYFTELAGAHKDRGLSGAARFNGSR